MESLSTPTPPMGEAAESAPIDLKLVAQQAEEILGTMLQLLMFQVKLVSSLADQSIRINLECDDPGRLIGRRGITVNQLQYLLNRILQRRHPSLPRIYLDVATHGEEEKIEEEKIEEEKIGDEFTQRMSGAGDQVRRWGQPVDLGTLKPAEQKVAQDLFAQDAELEMVHLDPVADSTKPQRMQLRVREKKN